MKLFMHLQLKLLFSCAFYFLISYSWMVEILPEMLSCVVAQSVRLDSVFSSICHIHHLQLSALECFLVRKERLK